jgi:hypothetical protein
VDPDLEALIGDEAVDKLATGIEVALDVVNAIFNLAFVARRARQRGADKLIALRVKKP